MDGAAHSWLVWFGVVWCMWCCCLLRGCLEADAHAGVLEVTAAAQRGVHAHAPWPAWDCLDVIKTEIKAKII